MEQSMLTGAKVVDTCAKIRNFKQITTQVCHKANHRSC